MTNDSPNQSELSPSPVRKSLRERASGKVGVWALSGLGLLGGAGAAAYRAHHSTEQLKPRAVVAANDTPTPKVKIGESVKITPITEKPAAVETEKPKTIEDEVKELERDLNDNGGAEGYFNRTMVEMKIKVPGKPDSVNSIDYMGLLPDPELEGSPSPDKIQDWYMIYRDKDQNGQVNLTARKFNPETDTLLGDFRAEQVTLKVDGPDIFGLQDGKFIKNDLEPQPARILHFVKFGEQD